MSGSSAMVRRYDSAMVRMNGIRAIVRSKIKRGVKSTAAQAGGGVVSVQTMASAGMMRWDAK